MIEFRLTMVGTLNGWVVNETNFIMIVGPMAQTLTTSPGRAVSNSLSGSVTSALRPYEPSSVQTISSSETAAILSSQKSSSSVARAHDHDDMVAGLLQVARDGIHRRDAHAARHAHHRAVGLDLGGMAQRPGDGVEAVADVHRAHLDRGLADFLEDQRDGARLGS